LHCSAKLEGMTAPTVQRKTDLLLVRLRPGTPNGGLPRAPGELLQRLRQPLRLAGSSAEL